MATMAEPGTEKRVDELSKRVDFGFEQTTQRLGRVEDDVRALRTEMKFGFDAVNARFDAMNESMNVRFEGTNRGMNDRFDGMNESVNVRFDAMNESMNDRFDG
jgi:hypothetical protein